MRYFKIVTLYFLLTTMGCSTPLACRHTAILQANQYKQKTGYPVMIAVGYVSPCGELHAEAMGISGKKWEYLSPVPEGFLPREYYSPREFVEKYFSLDDYLLLGLDWKARLK